MIETRPWGQFEVLFKADTFWLKRLTINPGQSLSLQSHKERDEYWVTDDEGVVACIGDKIFEMVPQIVCSCPAGELHRIHNSSEEPVHVIEWATGRPDEADITRYHDFYDR